MTKPNLFIVGAMKSGTSSLHAYLAQHPEIFMCSPKEPSYFVAPEQLRAIWPEMWADRYWESEDRYLALFEKAGDAAIVGESSTNYSKLPLITGVAERIRAYSSNARILYIMRDPVERAISHYWHSVQNEGETRHLNRAIRSDPHYIDVSDYAMQLAPYMDLFGPDNVLTLTFEELAHRPRETMSGVFQWLGVDPRAIPRNLSEKKNVTPPAVRQFRLWGITERLTHSELWATVAPLVPKGLRSAARTLLAERHVARDNVDLSRAKTYLREQLHPRTEALSRLVRRDFAEWSTLYGKTSRS